VEKPEMSNATLNDIRRYTIIGILIGSALLLGLPAGETSSGPSLSTCIAPNVAIGCQLWAEGNLTFLMPIGSISKFVTVSWAVPPRTPQPTVTLMNETDNQQDWQLPPVDFYLGSSKSWTVPVGPTELFGLTENEKICEFVYLCLPSSDGACTFYTNVVNAGTGGTHLRVQWSPDLVNWHDFLSDTTPIPKAGDIVISGTGLQFSQGGENTVPVNITDIKNNIPFNSPIVFRVIGFSGGGTITISDIFMTCVLPNTQQFMVFYTLRSSTSMDIQVDSLIPTPWLPVGLFPIRVSWRVWIS
jgi:hypothetical protein